MNMDKALSAYNTLTNKLDDDTRREVFSFIPSLAQVMQPILLQRYQGEGYVLEDFQIHQYSFGDGLLEFRVTGRYRVDGCWRECPSVDDGCSCGMIEHDINNCFAVGTRSSLLSLPLSWPSIERETVFPVTSGFYEGLWWSSVIGGQRV